MKNNMSGSYSSRMLPRSSIPKNVDTNKENKEMNRKPSVRSGKNVIQQYASNFKSVIPYSRPDSRMQSGCQTIENTLVFQECSMDVSRQNSVESRQVSRSKVYYKSVYQTLENDTDDQTQQVVQVRKDVDMMKSQIQAKDFQLSSLKQMYQSQMNNINMSINHKVQKDQTEKNTLIKEINSKNIEITKLSESHLLLESERQSLNIYLKEKEDRVGQLETELQVVQEQRDQLENYLTSINQSKEVLREVENKLDTLLVQNKTKSRQIEQDRTLVSQLNSQLSRLKSENTDLQKEIKKLHGRQNYKIGDLQDQLKKCKENSIKLNRELLKIPDLQMKLKESQSSCAQYQYRINQLIQSNDKINVQMINSSLTDRKVGDLEWQLRQLKNTLADTEEQFIKARDQLRQDRLDQTRDKLRIQVEDLSRCLQTQSRQIENLRCQIRENDIVKENSQREIQKMESQVGRLKERSLGLDELYKENRRLTSVLKDKIANIQRLELITNDLQHQVLVSHDRQALAQVQHGIVLQTLSEWESKSQKLSQSLNQVRQEKQALVAKNRQQQAQLVVQVQLVRSAKLQVSMLRQQREVTLEKHSADLQGLRSEIETIQAQNSQLKSTLEKEKEAFQEAKHNIDALNVDIKSLNDRIQRQLETINCQEAQIACLGSQCLELANKASTQKEQIDRLLLWKQNYLTSLSEYTQVTKDMMKAVLSLNQDQQ